MASKVYAIAFQLGAKLASSFGSAFSTASNDIKKLENQTKQANKSFFSLGSGAKKVFGVAAGLVGGISLAAAAKESVTLASDLVEVQNVVDTTFGGGASKINAWSKTALNSFGLSELQAKQFTGTLGAMMKSSGITGKGLVDMSENLTGLAGDFASFYNLPIEEAFEKIRSGISGETEPLKSLGINMDVTNLKAFALSQGIHKSWDSMSQAEQTQLRYNYLMKVSKDTQGDFAKTNKTFANQVRIAQTNLAQMGATIGTKLLPVLNKMLLAFNTGGMGSAGKVLNIVFKDMGSAISFVQQHLTTFKAVLAGVGSAIAAIKIANFVQGFKSLESVIKLVKGFQKVSATFQLVRMGAVGFGGALEFLIGPVGIAAVAIGLLVAAGYLLYKNWGTITKAVSNNWKWLGNQASAIFKGIGKSISNNITYIKNTVSNVFKSIGTVIGNAWKSIVKAITSSPIFKVVEAIFKGILAVVIVAGYNIYKAVTSVWKSISTAVSGALKAVWKVVTSIWNSIYSSISSVLSRIWSVIVTIWNSIYSSVSSVLTTIWSFIVSVWNSIYGSISSVVTTIYNTIISGFNSAYSGVTSIFQNMYNTVVSIFQGIWDAIKSIINSGIGMINGFIGGVNSAISVANKVPGVHIGTVGTIPQLASGGYIQHRPGGILANIGEGSEDEIVSPVSKLKSILGSTSIQKPQIVYSPQIIIQGSASKNDVMEALSMSQSEFNRMAENFFKNKQRLSFEQ